MENSKLDGMNALSALFGSEDELIAHFIGCTYFFSRDLVQQQARKIRNDIRMGQPITVRYTSNGAYFLQHAVKTTTPSFANISKVIEFTRNSENALFHRETKIRVRFDANGNYVPKRTIQECTGHLVGNGVADTVNNYTIAHIWSRTDNPLYFSLLWNYCLIPCHCTFLTDKREDSNPIIKRVKNLIKAISIELYSPNRIMDWNQDVIKEEDMPSKEAVLEARKFIKEGLINFLPNNPAVKQP